MPATAHRPITTETLRQAAPDILAAWRAWEGIFPGQTVLEAGETLAALSAVPAGAGLELLARAMNTPPADNGQPAAPRW